MLLAFLWHIPFDDRLVRNHHDPICAFGTPGDPTSENPYNVPGQHRLVRIQSEEILREVTGASRPRHGSAAISTDSGLDGVVVCERDKDIIGVGVIPRSLYLDQKPVVCASFSIRMI